MTLRLGIIGAGNMGRAIVFGAIEQAVLKPEELAVADIDVERRLAVARSGCRVEADARDVLEAEQLMLAVKPQSFPDVAAALGRLAEPAVVISIMAGVHSRTIRGALGEHARVVRVMPNTPCQIGAGMAAVARGQGAGPGDEKLAMALFEALGRATLVEERHMHAVTAVSGSGPAYAFLLAEAMLTAGIELGLDAATAGLLARQTIHGAGRLLDASVEDPAALRRAVTSKGGTTEAALEVLAARGWVEIVRDAVTAARDRGIELERE